MRKIRLNERDLQSIVRRVVNESQLLKFKKNILVRVEAMKNVVSVLKNN